MANSDGRCDAPPEVTPTQQKPIPWNLELLWALETGGRNEHGVLWAGTIPGGLFRSPDGGDSWEAIVHDLPAVLSVEVQTLQ